jgi:hypothetical protein
MLKFQALIHEMVNLREMIGLSHLPFEVLCSEHWSAESSPKQLQNIHNLLVYRALSAVKSPQLTQQRKS